MMTGTDTEVETVAAAVHQAPRSYEIAIEERLRDLHSPRGDKRRKNARGDVRVTGLVWHVHEIESVHERPEFGVPKQCCS